MCDCYQIGGPWIAEDPECPEHGTQATLRREEEEDRRINDAATIAELRATNNVLNKKIAELQALLVDKSK